MRKLFITTAIFILTAIFSMPALAQPPLYGSWQLMKIVKDGTEMPLAQGGKTPTMIFGENNGFSGNGSCNSYSGSYSLADGGKWTAGPVRSTKMACMGDVNTQEMNFFAVLGKVSQYRMSKGSLLLTDSGSQNTLTFLHLDWVKPGDPKPVQPEVMNILWIVNKEKVDCKGVVAAQKCLQVKKTDFAEWENFYSTIQGFKYKPGKYYLIRVKATKKKNVPADVAAYDYKLVKIMSRTKLMPHVD